MKKILAFGVLGGALLFLLSANFLQYRKFASKCLEYRKETKELIPKVIDRLNKGKIFGTIETQRQNNPEQTKWFLDRLKSFDPNENISFMQSNTTSWFKSRCSVQNVRTAAAGTELDWMNYLTQMGPLDLSVEQTWQVASREDPPSWAGFPFEDISWFFSRSLVLKRLCSLTTKGKYKQGRTEALQMGHLLISSQSLSAVRAGLILLQVIGEVDAQVAFSDNANLTRDFGGDLQALYFLSIILDLRSSGEAITQVFKSIPAPSLACAVIHESMPKLYLEKTWFGDESKDSIAAVDALVTSLPCVQPWARSLWDSTGEPPKELRTVFLPAISYVTKITHAADRAKRLSPGRPMEPNFTLPISRLDKWYVPKALRLYYTMSLFDLYDYHSSEPVGL